MSTLNHSAAYAIATFSLLASVVPSTARAEDTPATPTAAVDTKGETETAQDLSGWFRVDTDSLGTQLWFGANYALGSITLSSDIYVVGSTAELDIGPSFTIGDLSLLPMVGIAFDFQTTDVTTLVAPQLFTIWSGDKLYFESWIQGFINSVFTEGGEDTLYTRNFLLYAVNKNVAIGPQAELTYRISDVMDESATQEAGITSLPVGGRINLSDAKNTIGVFLGYETKKSDGADGIAGRFTFVRNW